MKDEEYKILKAQMPAYSLDAILDLLHRNRQRATYGAVARLVGKPPRFLMAGRRRDDHHCWVVTKRKSLPTGYEPEQMHQDLLMHEEVLSTPEQLESWFRKITRRK